jgi:hypothetical protein
LPPVRLPARTEKAARQLKAAAAVPLSPPVLNRTVTADESMPAEQQQQQQQPPSEKKQEAPRQTPKRSSSLPVEAKPLLVSIDESSVKSDLISNFSTDTGLSSSQHHRAHQSTLAVPSLQSSSAIPPRRRNNKSRRLSEIVRRDLWSRDPATVRQALQDLADRADQSAQCRGTIARTGGLLGIVRAMEQHATHAGVQVAACRALEKLALDTENELAIGEVGGVEAVLSAMTGHFCDAAVQEAAWSALWNLSCGNACDTMTIDTQEGGGIKAVVSCMKQHEHIAVVQENACGALANLCLDNEERCQALAAADGFVAIASALQTHWHDDKVRKEASHALVSLLERHVASDDNDDSSDVEELIIEEDDAE